MGLKMKKNGDDAWGARPHAAYLLKGAKTYVLKFTVSFDDNSVARLVPGENIAPEGKTQPLTHFTIVMVIAGRVRICDNGGRNRKERDLDHEKISHRQTGDSCGLRCGEPRVEAVTEAMRTGLVEAP